MTADSEPWVFTTPAAKIAVEDFPNDAEVQPELWIKSDLDIDWSRQLDKVALWDFEGNELYIEFVKEEKSYGFYPYRYLFACKEPLEPDSYHTLQVFEGVVAKAGPNLTKNSVEKDFHTFGALKLDGQHCDVHEVYRIRARGRDSAQLEQSPRP